MSEKSIKFEEVNGVQIFRENLEENIGTTWDEVRHKFSDLNDMPVRVFGNRIVNEGTYSNKEILAAIALGHIIQYPFEPSLIGKGSVDVRLGYHFYATDTSKKKSDGKKNKKAGLYNPQDPEDVTRYFGEHFEAAPLREQGELRRKLGIKTLNGIDPEHPIIIMRPGERLLGHTHEFLGILPPGMANFDATSTKGRNGVTFAQDATFINPGWVNRLVLEIKNENEDEYLPILFGDKVGQITYRGTGPIQGTYGDNGSYQHANAIDIETIVKEWRPSYMLPVAKPVKIPENIPGLNPDYI